MEVTAEPLVPPCRPLLAGVGVIRFVAGAGVARCGSVVRSADCRSGGGGGESVPAASCGRNFAGDSLF